MLSVQSLLLPAVGAVAIPVLGRQAATHGIGAGYALSAAVLPAPAGLIVQRRRHLHRCARMAGCGESERSALL